MHADLPGKGMAVDELWGRFAKYRENDVDWRKGRAPLWVFYAGDDVLKVGSEAYTAFMSENGLARQAFPSLGRMEDEVIGMVLGLLGGGEQATGTMTSGGSESIFLAMKAARDWAAEQSGQGEKVNLVAPRTAHPAFNKAAHYLGMQVKRVPVGQDFRADVEVMRAAMDASTVMLVGSAPAFPHGVVDPIDALSGLATSEGCWLHVDACVGGMSLPFIRQLGYEVPAFDFHLEGVRSMSADLHKYGFTPKGASTVLFCDLETQSYQPFVFDDWPKGRYQTPNLSGTRPGGAIAGAWAVMNYLGEEGYREIQGRIMRLREQYVRGIERIGEFRIFGKPHAGIISFGGSAVDPHVVAEELAKTGWYPSLLAEPRGIHLMLNLAHESAVDEYLADLDDAVARISASSELRMQNVRDVTY